MATKHESASYVWKVRRPKDVAYVEPRLTTLGSAIETFRDIMGRGLNGGFYTVGKKVIKPSREDPSASAPGITTAAGLNYYLADGKANPQLSIYYKNHALLDQIADTRQRMLLVADIYGESSGAEYVNTESGASTFRNIFVCGKAPGTEHIYTVGDNQQHTHLVLGHTKQDELPFRHLSHVYEHVSDAAYRHAIAELSPIFDQRDDGQESIHFEAKRDDGTTFDAPTYLGFAMTPDGRGVLEASIHSYPAATADRKDHNEIVVAFTKRLLVAPTRQGVRGIFR